MAQVMREYGLTVITIIALAIILGILIIININNEKGVTNIAGSEISKLADDDTTVTESATVNALNNQSTIPLPTVGVKANPQATVPITLNDIFAVANATEPVDLSVAEITTAINDPSTNVIGSDVTLNGKTLTFQKTGTYYITLEIRQTNRMMRETYKLNVADAPIKEVAQPTTNTSSNLNTNVSISGKSGGGSSNTHWIEGPLGGGLIDNSTGKTLGLLFTTDLNGNSIKPTYVSTAGKE